mmetsp:Transcript_2566/g.5072  ORF Transcript_2566/g.5072 Transcript_2566/m.5072 type:complete len:242 (+) Transcript_2566:78-803(+)|eukprot:CAMPEP_0167821650 /NCGR_PEP_ID=MMETSP0112_2-20121227/6938_1 /TAXON_ID=91324 /ORGANISM="Lotharella globosa, Strain CCCM811" /LENGTH=241 /DNA_ID=CAMNT_0007722689 /DNA_START=58 /DNA_END=783 /DNA_ORIENTATION=-
MSATLVSVAYQAARRKATSVSKRAQTNPFLMAVSKRARAYPVATSGLVIGVRYAVGDGVVQAMSGDSWDVRRTALFAAFGSTYAMTFGYGVYNVLYPALMPKGRPILNALIDCCTNSPFLYFPVYYIFREFAYEATPETRAQPVEVVKNGLSKWKEALPRDFKACFLFWLPVNSLNFWIVPLHFRQPFMAVVGFAWAMILSNSRGSRDEEPKWADEVGDLQNIQHHTIFNDPCEEFLVALQ